MLTDEEGSFLTIGTYMVSTRVDTIIRLHWQQMVHGSYFYRGMSLNNLHLQAPIVLDPAKNPFGPIIPLFMEYCEFLSLLIEKGLECNVNDSYVEPLSKVLGWTIRDLKNPGIDFTTNYADAASYAFNYAGSQIKHNFKLITSTIHEHRQQECFNKIESQRFWELTKTIQLLLEVDSKAQHQPIVIKVRRSCAAFQDDGAQEINLGSYEYFFNRVKKEATEHCVFTVDKIAFFLHQRSQTNSFNIRLVKPLHKDDIEDVIKL